MYRRGGQRRVSVYKNTKKLDDVKGKENLTHLTFSGESKMVLGELFSNYPPEEGGFGAELEGKHSGIAGKTREKKDDIFSKPSRKKAEIAKKVESFASRIEKDVKLKQVIQLNSLI